MSEGKAWYQIRLEAWQVEVAGILTFEVWRSPVPPDNPPRGPGKWGHYFPWHARLQSSTEGTWYWQGGFGDTREEAVKYLFRDVWGWQRGLPLHQLDPIMPKLIAAVDTATWTPLSADENPEDPWMPQQLKLFEEEACPS